MSIRLEDGFPSEKDSFLPTTDVKQAAGATCAAAPPTPRRSCSKARKALLVLGSSAALFALYSTFSHGGPGRHGRGHGLLGMFGGEYRQGWDIVRHGGGRWGDADRHGHDGFFADHERQHGIDWLEKAASLPPLALTTPVASTGYNPSANVTFPASTRRIVVALAPAVEAELVLVPAHVDHVGLVSVEEINAAADNDDTHSEHGESAVRIVGGDNANVDDEDHRAWAGIVICDTFAGAPKKYLITLALPQTAGCKPLDLVLQGDGLSLAEAGLDLAGVRLRRFELSSATGQDALVKNLHAHEGAIHLASGAIKGSFNVSRELILHTTIGAIEANVSIFAHPHHKKGKHNATAEVELERADESDDKLSAMSIDSEESHGGKGFKHDGPPPPPGPPPHGPPPHDGPGGPPRGPPPNLVKVLAHTDIGSIKLTYVDASLPSNKTSLISIAKAKIGDVVVGVVPGFKGRFVEAAKIGSVEYSSPGGSNVTIDKEIHSGPGGFVKGFVGAFPPHHPHGGDDKKNGTEHELYRFRADEEHRLGRQHKHDGPHEARAGKDKRGKGANGRKREHHHHHRERRHEDDDESFEFDGEFEGEHPPPPPPKGPKGPKGPGSPPPPPHDGPGGPPPHDGPGCPPHPPPHGPPPPPGYGFSGTFSQTGKVAVVFL